MDKDTLITVTDDLKYLSRLNYHSFKELLFPSSTEDYVQGKWEMFRENMLRFIWYCSPDKIDLLCMFINDCKGDA